MTLLQSIVPALTRAARSSNANDNQTAEARVKPAFTVNEDANGFDVVVQLPGVAKEGLELTAHDGELTIVGRLAWTQPADWTTLYRETPRANYELTLTHGTVVDTDKIGAELKNGVLKLTLPKAEAAKPRKITIN